MKKIRHLFTERNTQEPFKTKRRDYLFLLASTYMMSQHIYSYLWCFHIIGVFEHRIFHGFAHKLYCNSLNLCFD